MECKHEVLTTSPTTANVCARCGKLMPWPEGKTVLGTNRVPTIHVASDDALVVTLPDGASAVFRPSCDIAREVMRRIAANVHPVNTRAVTGTSRWIPVSERLPDIGQDVLAWTGWHVTAVYRKNGFRTEDDANPIFHVTHWMPLPAPPNSENPANRSDPEEVSAAIRDGRDVFGVGKE